MGVDLLRVVASVLVLAGVLMVVGALIELIVMAGSPEDADGRPEIESPATLAAWGIPGVLFLALGGFILATLQRGDDPDR